MLGQYRSDLGVEVRGVVEVFDVGAVDTEEVRDTDVCQTIDDVIHNAVRPHQFRYLLPHLCLGHGGEAVRVQLPAASRRPVRTRFG